MSILFDPKYRNNISFVRYFGHQELNNILICSALSGRTGEGGRGQAAIKEERGRERQGEGQGGEKGRKWALGEGGIGRTRGRDGEGVELGGNRGGRRKGWKDGEGEGEGEGEGGGRKPGC
ncbi:hypothetical protein AAC387_Pa10g1073 [Persea americana]